MTEDAAGGRHLEDADRIAELRDRLEQLETVRGAMDAAAFAALVRDTDEELKRLEAAGAEPAPEVAAGERAVVISGDATHVTILTGDRNRVVRQVPVAEAEPEILYQAYLCCLAGDCGHLPLGVIDSQFRGGVERAVGLEEVYVELDVTRAARPEEAGEERAWAWRLMRGEVRERTPATEAVAAEDACRFVLLGEPGSGKTTFGHHLCQTLALGGEVAGSLGGLVPVRFVLRQVAARHLPPAAEGGGAGFLWDALGADLAAALGAEGGRRLRPWLEEKIRTTGALAVFDGLDEVPEAGERRRVLLESIAAFAGSLAATPSRLLVTARPYAYADPAWQLEGFELLALAPLSTGQVDRFIERWYLGAARGAFAWSEETAEERARQLRQALAGRPYLGDLASRPLLLTLMATLHSSWGQLPEDRADLYEETVKLLLGRWQRAREVKGPGGAAAVEPGIAQVLGVAESRLRGALERLAYGIHRRQGGEPGRGEAPADVTRGEVLEAFEPLLAEVEGGVLLDYLEQRAGILISRRQGIYAFPHRSVQEYLAACHLGNLGDPAAEIRRHAFEDPVWWREVVLLALGRMKRSGIGSAVGALAVLQPESPEEETEADLGDVAWRVAGLCGQAVEELGLRDGAAERPHFAAALDRARRWLARLVELGRLPARERLEAGDVLGRLGDPRPGVAVLEGVATDGPALPDVTWVEIPAGAFTMGSPDDDELARDFEKPAHEVRLERFWLARYPVTNAQYRPFVEGGGYAERQYWSEAGWCWRRGEEGEPDLSWLSEENRETWRNWLAKRPAEKRDRPFYWDHTRLSAASRPVVGVTWHEAVAYGRWLEAWLGELPSEALPAAASELRVRLPSEAQWEKAARGAAGRRWPWGDEYRPEAWNGKDTELTETSPVGMFPAGATGRGLADMAGNVWEWTASAWSPAPPAPAFGYPYDPSDGREDLKGITLRVLRGSSFYNDKDFARCAARLRLDPDDFGSFVGFRVLLSLANSES